MICKRGVPRDIGPSYPIYDEYALGFATETMDVRMNTCSNSRHTQSHLRTPRLLTQRPQWDAEAQDPTLAGAFS